MAVKAVAVRDCHSPSCRQPCYKPHEAERQVRSNEGALKGSRGGEQPKNMQQKVTQIVGLAVAIAIASVLAGYLSSWIAKATTKPAA